MAALAAALALPASAEFVVLASGHRLPADRHELRGDRILLYRGEGVIELPLEVVAGFELDQPAAVAVRDAPVPAEPLPVAAGAATEAAALADPRSLVRQAAVRAGLPPAFVESVARVESAFRPDAVSPKGAIGVMQLMPETARWLGADPHDVRENIEAGTRLLRQLLIRYGGDVVKALAAYNAGPGAVDRYGGLPPYDETRHFVNKVIGAYQQSR